MSQYVSLLGSYVNGNYRTSIYNDGTKIRETLNEDDTQFIPAFAENCDVKITDRCDGGCQMCYEGCTVMPTFAIAFLILTAFIHTQNWRLTETTSLIQT